MSKIKNLHSVQRLRQLFRYDPISGVLYRLTTKGDVPCGTVFSTGHMNVAVDGKMTGVHRIAWALHSGEYPAVEIDHINGDGADNRLCNLRPATSAQNNQNRRLSARNKTGIKCVFKVKWGKSWRWRVAIGHANKKYDISHFVCFGQAVRNANQLRSQLHNEFARAA